MSEELFQKNYKSLNSQQREAVDTIEGPVMVIAGPGTGKTTILTLRIANILKKTDTPPSGILAITYTDAGVKAMKKKLRTLIGNRADEVKICTFHSFASSMISENIEHFLHLDKSTQLTDIESESLVRKLLEKGEYSELRPYGSPDFYVSKILSAISDCKRESFTPEMLESFARDGIKKIKADDGSYSTRGQTKGELKAEFKKQIEKCERTIVLSKFYKDYEETKKGARKIDFDDLIYEITIAMTRDELFLRILQERFLYVLVDEHQDTNNSQNNLILKLADFFDTPNVFIVGDEKQAIYRFQGASVENFLKFQKIWKNIKLIQLQDNYRSHQGILDASFSMIENNYIDDSQKELRFKLKSATKEKQDKIEVVSAGNVGAMELCLINSIKNILVKNSDARIAIITRTNRDLERVLRLFEANNIPVSSERSIDIFSHPLGSLFFDLIEFINDPSKIELISKALSSGLFNTRFDEIIAILKGLRSGDHAVLEKITGLNQIFSNINSDSPINFIISVAEISGLTKLFSQEPSSTEVWRGIVTLSENIARESHIYSPMVLLTSLVAYRASAELRSIKISVGTPDLPVEAMTAHGSKGLEFDYVFLPYANEESWIGRNRGNFFALPDSRSQNEIEDVRRLFYVALTRARKHVVILYAEEDAGEVLLPLRFIDELDLNCVSRRIIPKLEKNIPKEISGLRTDTRKQKIIDYAKSVLLEKGLSVTALNHFLNCPSTFLYQSILKIPQAPSAPAEKGNAVHLAISNIWKSHNRSTENIEQVFKTSIEYYFEQSLLPIFEKKQVIKDLTDDLPVVSRELHEHFNQSGEIFSETWSEAVFYAKYDNDTIEIPIHGKLDAIIIDNDTVKVFDYKTKQAMSENEILGKTKNSDGGYFRQLVFYKMLLSLDARFTKKNIVPALVFVVPDSKKKCPAITFQVTYDDIKPVERGINDLVESVWSGKFLEIYCDDKKCEWCKLKKIIV